MRPKYVRLLLAVLLLSFSYESQGQMITVSTGITTSTSIFLSSSNDISATFGIRNNNLNQIILMEVDYYHNTTANTSPYRLYYNPTPITAGINNFPTGWILIATTTISAPTGVTNIFNNLNFVIPASDVYSFALTSTAASGLQFNTSNATTPTISSNGNVDLLTYTNGIANGYTGFGATLSSPTNFPGAIRFIPGYPCSGKPGPSVITGPNPVCPNDTFAQRVQSGVGFVLDQEYQWQYSANGINWNNYLGPGYNTDNMQDKIEHAKYYRAIVTCKNSGLKDTTPAKKVEIAPFYYCYCKSGATDTGGVDIGNVTVLYVPSAQGAKIPGGDTVLVNGDPLPLFPNPTANKTYSSFQYSGPELALYRDSTYQISVTQVNRTSTISSGTAAVYLDWNRDGLYDPVNEKLMEKAVTDPVSSGLVEGIYKIPSNAAIGKTGFRVIISTASPVLPCGPFGSGETEDYIAEIKWEPCSGPVNAGTIVGDSSVCVGYDYLLADSSYERRKSAFARTWEISGDDITWANIGGSLDKDTLARVFNGQAVYYRVRAVCNPTKDTTYSNTYRVRLKDPYKCYCFSQAVGGNIYDSSDIGGFQFYTLSYQDGGTHLQNPRAIQKRTDHTDAAPLELDVDSIYQLKVFHSMRSDVHADAKITVFMDFNNNHVYDIPEDLVYRGYTNVGSFTLVDSIGVKPLAILNVPTGMRIILNNNIAPNIPSDEACGVYTSGETEDLMIMFRKKGFSGVGTAGELVDWGIHPNPSEGRFNVIYNGAAKDNKLDITITNVTGQQVLHQVYPHNGGKFVQELDISNQPKGVYFVELNIGNQRLTDKLIIK